MYFQNILTDGRIKHMLQTRYDDALKTKMTQIEDCNKRRINRTPLKHEYGRL